MRVKNKTRLRYKLKHVVGFQSFLDRPCSSRRMHECNVMYDMYLPLKQITAAFCPLQPLVLDSLFCHHGHVQAFMLSHHINLGKIPGLIDIFPTSRYYKIAGSWVSTDSRKRLDRFYKFRTGRFVRRPIRCRHAFR